MGRNSGGVNKGTADGGYRASKGATEKGYTEKMVKNIVGVEQKYRRNKDETLHVFNDKGDIVTSFAGEGPKVRFDGNKVPPNSILTHNHPRSIGASGIMRIGNSFSMDDVRSAVGVNAKEMRAVTPTYTFSLKRPKGGWGIKSSDVEKVYKRAEYEVERGMYSYLDKVGYGQSQVDRANVTHYHKVMTYLSNKYGWIYSKKKN